MSQNAEPGRPCPEPAHYGQFRGSSDPAGVLCRRWLRLSLEEEDGRWFAGTCCSPGVAAGHRGLGLASPVCRRLLLAAQAGSFADIGGGLGSRSRAEVPKALPRSGRAPGPAYARSPGRHGYCPGLRASRVRLVMKRQDSESTASAVSGSARPGHRGGGPGSR